MILLVMVMMTMVPFTVNHPLKKRNYMQYLRAKDFKSCITKILGTYAVSYRVAMYM